MTTEMYLAKETPMWKIWESVRMWLERVDYSELGNTKKLPTKYPKNLCRIELSTETVTIRPEKNKLVVFYDRLIRDVKWETELHFERGKRTVYARIDVKCSDLTKAIDMPRIVDIIEKRFNGRSKTRYKERPQVNLTGVNRQLDRIEHKVEETNGLINRLWDWFRDGFFKFFTKVFGIRKEATPELALEMLVRKNSYLRCFEKTKMKEPHKSQVIAVVEYVRNGHPIDHNARQNEIQSKTAYTINQAAEDVLRIAAEPCHKLSGAWTKAKDLADGCRQYMGKEDDPFVYKS